MKRSFIPVFAAMLALVTACSGSDSESLSNNGGGSTTMVASFTPDDPSPGSGTVSMAQGSVSGDLVTINVRVTGTNAIFGAAFDVAYDGSAATWTGWGPGSLFEQGGHVPIYQVAESQPGRLVVAATRQGVGATAVNASGTTTLIRLTFRVTSVGTWPVGFESAELLDAQLQPQSIPGIAWSGGTLVAN